MYSQQGKAKIRIIGAPTPIQPQNQPIQQVIQQPQSNIILNQQSPQKVGNKIKIKQPVIVDPSRANDFDNLIREVTSEIQQSECQYNISPLIENDAVIYQFWRFEFQGYGNFQGKCISGVLKFHQNHPIEPPKFYFDPVYTDQGPEVLQHLNIYGDHSLCIPLLTYWMKSTKEFEILQAIENIFHNPNQGDPANPIFNGFPEDVQNQIQLRQASYLKVFQLDR